MKENYVFFLGGYDAEMVEIKNILESSGARFLDKKLQWGASVSAYKEEIAKLSPDVIPVFIELELDHPIPDNSIIIDHHGEKPGKDKKTSIEQVAELLNLKLDRRQQLISANDRGHIRAMKKLCATDEEIREIRGLDRKAQGVSDEDERLAEESIKKHSKEIGGNAVIINSFTNKTSPIFDRVYDKYNHIFIFTPDGEINYSGTGAVVNSLVKKYKENPSSKFWYGGELPDYGFFGAKSPISEDEIKGILRASDKKIISQHIFAFPFRLKTEDNIKDLKEKFEKEGWQYKPFDFKFGDGDAAAKYNEYVYFHEYVRRAIFSSGSDDISYYYDREIPDGAKIVLSIKNKKQYTLPIDHISLRLFDTNVGILTIELLNYDYPDVIDIFHINEFGRRIYPQFIDEQQGIEGTKKIFLADKIELYFGNMPITEDFKCEDFLRKELRVACYIRYLLGETLKDKFIPVIDDRMFTVCWYANDNLSSYLGRKKGNEYEYESSDIWYSFIYVDGSVAGGIADKEMQRELIKAATYRRWAEAGSLYGISRYSLVCITDSGDFAYNNIRNHMQRMYYQMAIILLAQRASILKFSDDVSKISGKIECMKDKHEQEEFKKIAEEVKNLHSSFIYFVNRLWFTEVTPQEQGIEMYNMAVKNMGLKEQLDEVRHEIKELYEFVEMEYNKLKADEDRRINKKLEELTIIAMIFLPITVAASVFGMNLFNVEDIPKFWSLLPFEFLKKISFWQRFLPFILLTLLLYIPVIIWYLWKKKSKPANVISNR